MYLDNEHVRDFLVAEGIQYLYHANTVRTSCTFLRNGGLLSRGYVIDHGLSQTSQKSDAIDKKYGIWHDIFFDDCDIHQRSGNANFYGPVLFKFSIDVLLANTHSPIKITKRNPINWKRVESLRERYFYSIDELEASYSYGNFGQMITLYEVNGVLQFEPYLIEIIVDAPERNIHSEPPLNIAINALKAAGREGGVRININARVCRSSCKCNSYYDSISYPLLRQKFCP